MKTISSPGRLDATELRHLHEQGYVVRRDVFSRPEVAEITAACESLVDSLTASRQGHRLHVGSYVFDPDLQEGVMIKWEGDSDVVHGIEPFAHLSPALHDLALDSRFTEPMKDLVGDDEPTLFTEKLNLKRAHHGGPNPLHQDHPYWVDASEVADRIATAILFLDDATVVNGCLHLVPGSHRDGPWQTRTDGDAFLANEIDVEPYTGVVAVPVEATAGTVVFFGAFLVHQSAPNTSDHDRRALLYSYQPPGHPTMVDGLRALVGG